MGVVSGGGGGGGGSSTPHGFLAEIAASSSSLSNGGTIPFDVTTGDNLFDTDGFLDPATHIATIPAGLAGLYVVTLVAVVTNDASLTGMSVQVSTSGSFDNINLPGGLGSAIWPAGGSTLGWYAAGNTITPKIGFDGVASVSVVGRGNSSLFGLAYLGAVTPS